jgi:hypothetical protein
MTNGIAYIIETRNHPNLALVLENADQCLPQNWAIWCFYSDANKSEYQRITENMLREVKLVALTKPIKNLNDYNHLLLSKAFWQQFTAENLLGIQTDTLINENAKHKLKELLAFDYIGAPWSSRIHKRFPYLPEKGGNGGMCFSKKSARLQALEKAKTPRSFTDEKETFNFNEDIWFSKAIAEIGLRLADPDTASSLFVESIITENPFAVHKPWNYVKTVSEKNAYAALLEKMPQLKTLQQNCENPQYAKPSTNVNSQKDFRETSNEDKSESKNESKNSYRKFLLDYARDRLHFNNFSDADLALQVCESRYPNHPVAFNLHGLIAFKVGALIQAEQFVRRSLAIEPGFKKAQDNLKAIQKHKNYSKENTKDTTKDTTKESDQRFLLINSWGSGFGFDLLYLLGQLLVAELSNRTPVIHWGKNSMYNQNSENPKYNAFNDFFEPINALTCEDMQQYTPNVYPEHWQERELSDYIRRTRWRNTANKQRFQISSIYYLAREEKVAVSGEYCTLKMLRPWLPEEHELFGQSTESMYRHLYKKYLKPNSHIQAQAKEFIEEAFGSKSFYAIHLRGTDKYQEAQSKNINEINQQLVKQLELDAKKHPIFLMTDDANIATELKKQFGSQVHFTKATRVTESKQGGVHHQSENKRQIGEEVLIDILIAAKAAHFYGCGFSYLADLISAIRTEKSSTLLPWNLLDRFIDIPKEPEA